MGAEASRPAATPEEVRAEIERARAQIARSAAALRDEVAATADWREWVRRRPGVLLAGAFALGFFIGYRR